MASEQRSPSLSQALADIIAAQLVDVHTAIQAQVINYYPSSQTCDVQIVLKSKRPCADGVDTTDFPTIPNVRMAVFNAGGFFISFPVATGDLVWLQFGEQSHDRWAAIGENPTDDPNLRRFDMADAIALPCGRASGSPVVGAGTSDMRMGASSGLQVILQTNLIQLGSDSLGPTDGVVHGSGIDPFTGATYTVLGNTSSVVKAKKA